MGSAITIDLFGIERGGAGGVEDAISVDGGTGKRWGHRERDAGKRWGHCLTLHHSTSLDAEVEANLI